LEAAEDQRDNSDVTLSERHLDNVDNTRLELAEMASRRQRMTYSRDVEAFASRHKRRAEDLVLTEFPRKVRLMDELLHRPQFSREVLADLMEETATVRATTTTHQC